MLLTKRKLAVVLPTLFLLFGVLAEAAAAPVDNAIEKADLEKAWTALAATDNAEALRSLLVLYRAPKDSVPFVTTRMKVLLSGEAPAHRPADRRSGQSEVPGARQGEQGSGSRH